MAAKSLDGEVCFRLILQDGDMLEDLREDISLSEFGGIAPSAGDTILSRWLIDKNLRGHEPTNRTFLEVVRRVFHPERENHHVLVVRQRVGTERDRAVIGG